MRLTTTVLALAATGAALIPAAAQDRTPQARSFTLRADGPGEHRAALGIATTATGTARDTLGVLITSITRGSPAERAGLEEGNRIAAINGVSLRASAADLEDEELSGTLSRRLVRELAKAKPGDEVELRVYRDGRTTSMKVRTADSDSLFRRRDVARLTRADIEDRAALGLGVASTGNRRDTLGVFVTSVGDSTPAARAGIEEGNRIAAINGTSLRVAREDAGDRYAGALKAQRLQREIAELKPGSDVTLRVYANGQFRDVHVKAARLGDLPRERNRMMIFGGDGPGLSGFPMAPLPPMSPGASGRMRVLQRPSMPESGDASFELGPEFRRQLDALRREVELLGPELESIGPALDRVRPELDRIRTEVPRAIREARAAAQASRVM